MRRGDVYRSRARLAERGRKPGFYVVVSRSYVARSDAIATVVCAPVYGNVLDVSTEVIVGPEEGLPRVSAIRCDFLTLMFKTHLTQYVSRLSPIKLRALNLALGRALELEGAPAEDEDPDEPV